ncbi:GerAB/ArcD/ProY family transporter [Niallia endozanthoxylica]|uniref:GerAB/ArcD/ProY family transporter n=1 Tax=Niallia endozanthoxylica TaxID=2036016 RepID=A0A5J5I9C9_9BACI|nr:endospore germination permease [Niallia endozanthoxylica]KAA9032814.1 GerAB/ArcD/ProY family transporter [Niallia endozanthoxylica]
MKITGLQIYWIMFSILVGNTVLITITPAVKYAKQDMWMSYLIAGLGGTLIVFLATKAALLYPKHTLIEYSKFIFGKWIGILTAILYLVYWYTVIGNILGEFTEFVSIILLPKTPHWILLLTILLLLVYIAYIGGIEAVGRCGEVFGPIIFMSFILLIAFTIPNLQFNRILPIYADSGLYPIIRGSFYPLSFLGESVLMLMLISFMDQPEKGTRRAVWGVLSAAVLITFSTVSVILIFGPAVSAKLKYPIIETIRYINVMNFIQNLEIVAVLIWILSLFIKLSLYFVLAAYGTAQLFHIKDWKKLIWVVAVISFLLAMVFSRSTTYGMEYIEYFWLPVVLTLNMAVIPLLLWMVGSLRKKKQASNSSNG